MSFPSSPAPRSRAAPAPPTARCAACTSPAARRLPCSARARSASAPRCSARRWARASSRSRKNAERRELAKRFGAADALESEERIKEITKGEGVDLALDTTGAPAARLAAIRSAKTWGTVCFVGEGGDVTIDVSRDMLRKQLTHHRLVDLQRDGPARMRALRRRQRRSTSTPSSRTAGSSSRPTRPTACSTRSRPARASLLF